MGPTDEADFADACAQYTANADRYSDAERLHLYALYKQATAGPAPCVTARGPTDVRRERGSEGGSALAPPLNKGRRRPKPPGFVALIRGARHAAWRRVGAFTKAEARRRYVELVRRAEGSSAALGYDWAAVDESLVSTPLDKMDRDALLKLASSLREKVQTLSVGQVFKAGALARYRETMTGGDWAERWFEVVPGWLRCYRSRTHRELRLEIPLSTSTDVVVDDDVVTWRGGSRHVIHVELASPAPCAAQFLQRIRLSSKTRDEADAWVAAIRKASKGREDAPDAAPPQVAPPPRARRRHGSSSKLAELDTAKRAGGAASPAARRGGRMSLRRFVHQRARVSLLSTDASESQSFGGLVNLLAIVTVVSNARQLLHEWDAIPLVQLCFAGPPTWAALQGGAAHVALALTSPLEEVGKGVACALGCAFVALAVERLASRVSTANTWWAFDAALAALVSASLAVPTYLICAAPPRPAVHAGVLSVFLVWAMKLTSWAHTNSTLRRTAGDEPASPKTPSARGAPAAPHGNEYPLNLRAADLAMFYAFPTLVYQTAYPRTPRVRRAWLAKRCLELALVLAVMALVVTQLVLPKVAASYAPVDSGDVADVFGSVLALAVPSLSVWMLMFVALFEIWLNIVAEATRFGDRLFYRDWWNASKFDEYWRLWNVPVHNWLVRHVFYPILDAGYSKPAAMIAVFFVSASLHEVLVSAPCHVLRLYAFAGMMAQIPLIYLTNILADKFPKSRVGNVLFWCTFCVFGQPLCLMIYFHDSVEAHAAAAPLAQAVHALANLTATGEL